jgi:hypothetical protein
MNFVGIVESDLGRNIGLDRYGERSINARCAEAGRRIAAEIEDVGSAVDRILRKAKL